MVNTDAASVPSTRVCNQHSDLAHCIVVYRKTPERLLPTGHFPSPDPVAPVTIEKWPEKIPPVERRHNPHISLLSSNNTTLVFWIRTPASFRKRVSENNVLSTGLQAYVKGCNRFNLNRTASIELWHQSDEEEETEKQPNKIRADILHYLPCQIYNRKSTKYKRIILQAQTIAQLINLVTILHYCVHSSLSSNQILNLSIQFIPPILFLH
jgi:hypothetical protein